MGMSIDEAIEHGKEQLEIFGGKHREFIETSIDTMRRYEKIQEIVDDRYGKPTFKFMDAIIKVVEDGKTN